MPTKEAPAGPSFGDSYATVPIVAPTPVAVTPATTELCAPHNRRLLTDDRRLAASRLPERARRPAGVASETVDRKRPHYFRERGEVRRGGISGLQLRREGRGRRRATRARRFGLLRCLDVRACDIHRTAPAPDTGLALANLRRSRRG